MRPDNPILALLRALFAPFTFLYGLGAALRNYLYDKGFFESTSFQVPVIAVGNLSVGGTGKTPMVDYLIRLLSPVRPAVLSRGYGRQTKGFRMVSREDGFQQAGDEPSLLAKKYPGLAVAVGENRMLAIPELLSNRPESGLIILDDAFQHRSVKPGLNILLTAYHKPFFSDRVLPWGELRENRSGYKRADIIIVTKCPAEIGEDERQSILERIKPQPFQKVYFAGLRYGQPYRAWSREPQAWDTSNKVIALSGIADPSHFEGQLEKISAEVRPRRFSDHHVFDRYDMESLRDSLTAIGDQSGVIVTTEKDWMRLMPFQSWFEANDIRLWILPVAMEFLGKDGDAFRKDMEDFITYYAARN